MNEREQSALDALLQSKKYGAICEDTVRRAFERALENHKKLKDADKAARTALHQIAGAFLTVEELRDADALLPAYQNGDADALRRTLALHASTRERQAGMDDLFSAAFEITGKPALILDIACGLNPLYLGARGFSVRGYDIHRGAVQLINRWAEACGWDVRAEVSDALFAPDYPAADMALVMKLLPVLSQQESAAPVRVLKNLPTQWKLVTFPTRTLGGRRVGMEKHYSDQFEKTALAADHEIVARYLSGDELCYIVKGDKDANG